MSSLLKIKSRTTPIDQQSCGKERDGNGKALQRGRTSRARGEIIRPASCHRCQVDVTAAAPYFSTTAVLLEELQMTETTRLGTTSAKIGTKSMDIWKCFWLENVYFAHASIMEMRANLQAQVYDEQNFDKRFHFSGIFWAVTQHEYVHLYWEKSTYRDVVNPSNFG